MKTILLALCLFFANIALAAESHYKEEVIATGYGMDAASSLNNAMENAVQQVIETRVSTETFARNLHLLSENILVSSAGYIEHYEILMTNKERDGQVRTVIEAKVHTEKLIEELRFLRVAMLETKDGEDIYAQVFTNSNRIEATRSYINKEFPKLFQPLNRFTKIDIEGIHFDEGNITGGKVPYMVQFTLASDYDAYDASVKQFLEVIAKLEIAEELAQDGYLSKSERNTYSIGMDNKRRGDMLLAVKHGQRYILNPLDIVSHYKKNIASLMDRINNVDTALFRIKLLDKSGTSIYEDVFNLRPSDKKLTVFLGSDEVFGSNEVFWLGNGAEILSIAVDDISRNDKRSKITPLIYMRVDGELLAVDSITMGYQNSLELDKIKLIDKVSIERVIE